MSFNQNDLLLLHHLAGVPVVLGELGGEAVEGLLGGEGTAQQGERDQEPAHKDR